MLFGITITYSQIGINTENPKATLDIKSSPSDLTVIDGIIPPRLSGDELKSKETLYGSDHVGTIVYITSAVTSPSTITANVNESGHYHFDGTLWHKMKLSSVDDTNDAWVNDAPNSMVKLGTQSDAITTRGVGSEFVVKDNGNVGIGTSSPTSTLAVKGSYEGNYKEIASNITLSASDQYINVLAANAITITLPDAANTNSFFGRVYHIKNSSNEDVTISGYDSDQDIRTSSNVVASNFVLKKGSSAKIIKNNNTVNSEPLWEVFDQGIVYNEDINDFLIGQVRSARVVVPAAAFNTDFPSNSVNIMTGGRTNTGVTNKRAAYEILVSSSDPQINKFIVINGLRMDYMSKSSIANSARLYNTTNATIQYNLSGLSTNDANINSGVGMSINANYYSYRIDGNDDMTTDAPNGNNPGRSEYVNAMLTFDNGEWYNCTWHSTRDDNNYYFYMTAQRLN